MKSYTDIDQSMKLAKILPLESANMYYPNRSDIKINCALPIEWKNGNPLISQEIPAWSLAALLDVLPKYIGDYGKCLYYDIGFYHCGYMVDGDFMLTIEETKADNSVDACYKMVIRLHEKGLL